jgi:hypothetical protein
MGADFIPELSGKYDVSHFDSTFTSEDAIISLVPESQLEQIQKYQEEFEDFK